MNGRMKGHLETTLNWFMLDPFRLEFVIPCPISQNDAGGFYSIY